MSLPKHERINNGSGMLLVILIWFTLVLSKKAEFFTLKGMFLSKLRAYEEANQAFATAVQIDLNLAKAWAQWGSSMTVVCQKSQTTLVLLVMQ